MEIFVALLRGINVSGHNIIRMADLKDLFEELGFAKVKTYIQSGNVLFEAAGTEVEIVRKIESGIKSRFALEVPVILRKAEELAAVVANCPYPESGLAEGETVHVAFLPGIPGEEAVTLLLPYRSEGEDFTVIGRDMYLLLRNFHLSKLPVQLKKLNMPATIRNWRTVNKLAGLAKEV